MTQTNQNSNDMENKEIAEYRRQTIVLLNKIREENKTYGQNTFFKIVSTDIKTNKLSMIGYTMVDSDFDDVNGKIVVKTCNQFVFSYDEKGNVIDRFFESMKLTVRIECFAYKECRDCVLPSNNIEYYLFDNRGVYNRIRNLIVSYETIDEDEYVNAFRNFISY